MPANDIVTGIVYPCNCSFPPSTFTWLRSLFFLFFVVGQTYSTWKEKALSCCVRHVSLSPPHKQKSKIHQNRERDHDEQPPTKQRPQTTIHLNTLAMHGHRYTRRTRTRMASKIPCRPGREASAGTVALSQH